MLIEEEAAHHREDITTQREKLHELWAAWVAAWKEEAMKDIIPLNVVLQWMGTLMSLTACA